MPKRTSESLSDVRIKATAESEYPAPEDFEIVLTFNGATGALAKAERVVDKTTGKREALSEEEYACLLGQDLSGSWDFAAPYSMWPADCTSLYPSR